MTRTSTGPRLTTPTGGAMTLPSSPAQWHGHPYVWSWHVSLASLDPAFIEARCKEAEDDAAPPDAVYKTSPNDPVTPNTWITVNQLGQDNRDRVRDYGRALLKWQQDLQEYRRKVTMRPPAQEQHMPAEAPAAGGPAQAPAAAQDTAVPTVHSEGRGIRAGKSQPD